MNPRQIKNNRIAQLPVVNEYAKEIGATTGENLATMAVAQAQFAAEDRRAAEITERNRLRAMKTLGKGAVAVAKKVPYVAAAAAVKDGYSGYTNAGDMFNTATPTMGQKLSGAAGGVVHGASFGTVPEEVIARGLYDTGSAIGNGLHYNRPVGELADPRIADLRNYRKTNHGEGVSFK